MMQMQPPIKTILLTPINLNRDNQGTRKSINDLSEREVDHYNRKQALHQIINAPFAALANVVKEPGSYVSHSVEQSNKVLRFSSTF